MRIKVGDKCHYHTYRVRNGIKEEYVKNIIVDHIYPNGAIGFKEKGQDIHSLVNKKHLKKGWVEKWVQDKKRLKE